MKKEFFQDFHAFPCLCHYGSEKISTLSADGSQVTVAGFQLVPLGNELVKHC